MKVVRGKTEEFSGEVMLTRAFRRRCVGGRHPCQWAWMRPADLKHFSLKFLKDLQQNIMFIHLKLILTAIFSTKTGTLQTYYKEVHFLIAHSMDLNKISKAFLYLYSQH